PPAAIHSPRDDGPLRPPGSPIRTPEDQSPRAAPLGFSQLATSFIACPRLGIHHAPFRAWPAPPFLREKSSDRPTPHSKALFSGRALIQRAPLFPLNPRCQTTGPHAKRGRLET